MRTRFKVGDEIEHSASCTDLWTFSSDSYDHETGLSLGFDRLAMGMHRPSFRVVADRTTDYSPPPGGGQRNPSPSAHRMLVATSAG